MILLSASAWAFVGVFVGEDGAPIANPANHVVVAWDGIAATVTVAPDVAPPGTDFGWLIPVPAGLAIERVRAIDPAHVTALADFGRPRLDHVDCETGLLRGRADCVGCAWWDDEIEVSPLLVTGAFDDEPQPTPLPTEYGAQLVNLGLVGGPEDWLAANGFALPPGAEAIVDDYLAEGWSLLAVTVHVEELPALGRLDPLQIAFPAAELALPTRLGALGGGQDLTVHAIGSGDLGIADLTRQEPEQGCMWDPATGSSLADWYLDQVRGGYATELSWTLYEGIASAPCPACPVPYRYRPGHLGRLGWSVARTEAILTRLRVLDPAVDLALTRGGHGEDVDLRWATYDPGLEFLLPVCGQGYREDPGQCEGAPPVRAAAPVPLWIGALALLALRRRR